MALVFVKNAVDVHALTLSAYGTILYTDQNHLLCLFWFLLCFRHYETPGPFNINFCEAHEFCGLYFVYFYLYFMFTFFFYKWDFTLKAFVSLWLFELIISYC